jgi:abequosyltransferase
MSTSLSISIPVYNFARFLPETLDSIVHQDGSEAIEIIVLDGASTDNTATIMENFQKEHPNVRYFRMAAKGGIDRDMAQSVAYSSGDYCWLFSGDDIMRPGALRKVLDEIQSGCDVYLCRHKEYYSYHHAWREYPAVKIDRDTIFELSDARTRQRYFSLAVNSEAFFSFIGGIIVKRATWDRVPLNEMFVGGCWAHAARMFELMPGGLRVKCLLGALLDRRPDNDSFAAGGLVNRYRIAIDGYHGIADHFFGHDSIEAFHVRRVIRHEFHPMAMLLGKYMCALNPQVENKAVMDGLMRKAYSDFSFENLRAKFIYATTSASRFKRQQKELCESHEQKFLERTAARAG